MSNAGRNGAVTEGELIWTPSSERASSSNISKYMQWLSDHRGLRFDDYSALWAWSVESTEEFWASIWDYFEVESDTPYRRVLTGDSIKNARWFDGARLNYAQHMLRYERLAKPGETAFHHVSELAPLARMSWQELGRKVRIVATQLRKLGVKPGDRVVSYMPNIPETAVAMIATVAIGGVWSSASPEFGVRTVIDRFAQIEPVLMFAGDGYRFGGRDFRRDGEVREIASSLPSLRNLVWFNHVGSDPAPDGVEGAMTWSELLDHPDVPEQSFEYERVESSHPLWILFSSGTTGLPKAIVHPHGGMLIEHLKLMHFHVDLAPGSVMFFYSTTGWMMWNLLMAALLTGSSSVLYDGSPQSRSPEFLWKLAEQTGATSFGASPTFVQAMENAGIRPAQRFDLSNLQSILLAGSPSTPEVFSWFYREVKQDLWLTSQSGGTELCSAFVGAVPTLPVYAGEIQARTLGMDVHSWNDGGDEVFDEVGELVVTKPFPSAPLCFWGDGDGARYHEAYFDVFPGVWRHGDLIKINRRGGCYIYGRSDSTLNRYGVRIGTAEVYRIVEQVDGVADSLVVHLQSPDGRSVMPLFVRLQEGAQMTEELRRVISDRLRTDGSPRHVPSVIEAVPAIPYTLTGKKMEIPVQKILSGQTAASVASPDAMQDPEALTWFESFDPFATKGQSS